LCGFSLTVKELTFRAKPTESVTEEVSHHGKKDPFVSHVRSGGVVNDKEAQSQLEAIHGSGISKLSADHLQENFEITEKMPPTEKTLIQFKSVQIPKRICFHSNLRETPEDSSQSKRSS
jgi:hypothetical protein